MNEILKNTQKPPCPYFTVCGNCDLMRASYENQLAYKTELAASALTDFSKAQVFACQGMYYPYKYRNKLTLALSNRGGPLKIGFYRAGTKDVIDVKSCMLHEGWYEKVYACVRDFIEKFKVDIFDRDHVRGALRYVVCRCVGDALLITVVSTRRKVIGLSWLFKRLKMHFRSVSLYLNVNNSNFSNVFSNDFVWIEGEKTLPAKFLGATVELLPRAFLQTNEKMAGRVFQELVKAVEKTDDKRIVDAYCGVGITSLLFAKNGLSVIGIEREEQSVAVAKRLARVNKLEDVTFLQGDAAQLLPQALEGGVRSVFVDPPRSGLADAIEPLLAAAPQNLFYLSCSPESLRVDLAALKKQYDVLWAKPFDMFPQTKHVETLVQLVKKI